MQTRSLFLIVFFLVCGAALLHAQPEDYPTYDPSQALYTDLNAQLLAEEVKQRYDGKHWDDSILIEFDHVLYTKDDKEVERYHHMWNRLTDEAMLSGTLDDGRTFEVRFSNLSERTGTMIVDSVPIREEYLPTSMRTAYGQFMRNVHWLLLPVQLLDPGVILKRLPDTLFADKVNSVLSVTFEPDSAANIDQSFILYINPTFNNIERWRVTENGSSQDFIWRLYRRVKPFLFSTKRWSEDFGSYVMLENIEVTELTPETIAAREKEE